MLVMVSLTHQKQNAPQQCCALSRETVQAPHSPTESVSPGRFDQPEALNPLTRSPQLVGRWGARAHKTMSSITLEAESPASTRLSFASVGRGGGAGDSRAKREYPKP